VAKGLPEAERPPNGHEEDHWKRIVEITLNTERKQECLKRDEKFDMHFSAAVGTNSLHHNSKLDLKKKNFLRTELS
jgi:cysteinyl-tRNA synthetase